MKFKRWIIRQQYGGMDPFYFESGNYALGEDMWAKSKKRAKRFFTQWGARRFLNRINKKDIQVYGIKVFYDW